MNANEIARSPKLRSGSLVGEANAHNLWDILNVRPMCVFTLRQLHSTRSYRLMVLFVINFIHWLGHDEEMITVIHEEKRLDLSMTQTVRLRLERRPRTAG